MNGFTKVSPAVRQRPSGIASTSITNELASRLGGSLIFGQPGLGQSQCARRFIIFVVGKEAGAHTYTCDAYDLPRENLGASMAAVDRGTKLFEGAIFKDLYLAGDLWPDDVSKRTTVSCFAELSGPSDTTPSSRPVFCGFPIAFGGCDTSGGGDTTSGDDGGY